MRLKVLRFQNDEIYTLIAMCTPYRDIGNQHKNNQSLWYFDAIFHQGISGTGKRVTVPLPWSMFPMMRCGDQYQAGQRIPQVSLGNQKYLDFT